MFRFLRKWTEDSTDCLGRPVKRLHCEYEASFWDGPSEPGEVGRRVKRRCRDVVMGRTRSGIVIGKAFLNTSPSVSYYGQLRKACGI